ncbi:tripartite tricarboxylate transporter permease [Candidatus Woesearchaeota archaeon]|nr:tripartite tricarboxylate transporter permease [Candidatus Woesearchaeota archaeon]
MIEYLLGIVIGILFGIITGLTPGVHINLVSVMLLSISAILLEWTSPLMIAVIIISMGVTHTFLDAIPSVFLGAPDPDTVMAVLPGHKLLFEGKGWDAVRLTVIGSLLCLILAIVLMPLFALIFPIIYSLMKPILGWILILIVFIMIIKDSNKKWAITVFIFSGILGLIVLRSEIRQPLFPLLSGMFGISALLLSLSNSVEVPLQVAEETIDVNAKDFLAIIGGAISGSFVALFPGLGAAQAAALSTIVFKIKEYAYLILVGGINTVNFVIALVSVYTIEKARNGAIAVVMEIISEIDLTRLIFFAAITLIVGGIATILTLKIAKGFAKVIEWIDYKWISLGIIGFITVLSLILSGWVGLIVLVISTAVGVIPQLCGCCRSNAMGCLLLPVIVFYVL